MTLLVLMLITSLCIVEFSLSQWSMDGKTQIFTFVTDKPVVDGQISWLMYNGIKNLTYFLCSTSTSYGMNCSLIDENIKDFYSANLTSNSTSYISVFTITKINLSLHKTRWFCSADFNTYKESEGFDLYVFAAAESPTCDSAQLINESNIQIKCWTNKVFPGNLCLFKVKTNGSSEFESEQRDISYTREQNLTTLYYKTTCTFVVSAAILGPGTHLFNVTMYPNITSTITVEMNRTSEYTNSIYLGYPRAVLGTDCDVQGYIKENVQSKCTCYDSSKSFLPTNISWLLNKSPHIDKGTLIFTAKRRESFQCTASSQLNWTNTIDFNPNISYPPDTLNVSITKQVFDLCNDTNIFLSGTCFVGESNPEPSITLNINNILMDITAVKHNRDYMFNINMTYPGIYYINCLANNMEYSKNTSSITKNITIKGPPDVPKIFKNGNSEKQTNSTNLLEIVKGDTINCEAKGGYPILKDISLKCGLEKTRETNKDHVSLTVTISNVTHGMCECVVWHEANCQQNTSTAQYKFSQILPAPGQDFGNIYIGIGVVAGGIIVILATIFIFRVIHHSQLDRRTSGSYENLVNNGDVYFIKQDNSGIDVNIYPEYTNIVTTMASAMEAPKNFKKK